MAGTSFSLLQQQTPSGRDTETNVRYILMLQSLGNWIVGRRPRWAWYSPAWSPDNKGSQSTIYSFYEDVKKLVRKLINQHFGAAALRKRFRVFIDISILMYGVNLVFF